MDGRAVAVQRENKLTATLAPGLSVLQRSCVWPPRLGLVPLPPSPLPIK